MQRAVPWIKTHRSIKRRRACTPSPAARPSPFGLSCGRWQACWTAAAFCSADRLTPCLPFVACQARKRFGTASGFPRYASWRAFCLDTSLPAPLPPHLGIRVRCASCCSRHFWPSRARRSLASSSSCLSGPVRQMSASSRYCFWLCPPSTLPCAQDSTTWMQVNATSLKSLARADEGASSRLYGLRSFPTCRPLAAPSWA